MATVPGCLPTARSQARSPTVRVLAVATVDHKTFAMRSRAATKRLALWRSNLEVAGHLNVPCSDTFFATSEHIGNVDAVVVVSITVSNFSTGSACMRICP